MLSALFCFRHYAACNQARSNSAIQRPDSPSNQCIGLFKSRLFPPRPPYARITKFYRMVKFI